jgi:hypothetical protein
MIRRVFLWVKILTMQACTRAVSRLFLSCKPKAERHQTTLHRQDTTDRDNAPNKSDGTAGLTQMHMDWVVTTNHLQ